MAARFELGYIFGRRLAVGGCFLMRGVPTSGCKFGVVRYKCGNASYVRVTKEELQMLNSGDSQWLDHEHMLARSGEAVLGSSAGEAIANYIKSTGDNPGLYIKEEGSSGPCSFRLITGMTADEIDSLVNPDSTQIYYFDEESDGMTGANLIIGE